MSLIQRRVARRVGLAAPIIVLVLAFTAIPMELRPLNEGLTDLFDFGFDLTDSIQNVLGFIPIGLVLVTRGLWSTAGIAAAVSAFAETSQLFTVGRSPSLLDVATNIAGAVAGWAIGRRCRVPSITIPARRAIVAALAAIAYVAFAAQITPDDVEDAVASSAAIVRSSWLSVNDRGAAVPGRLEARWTFASPQQPSMIDPESGLTARLIHQPTFEPGVADNAIVLDGATQYVDLGDPAALRLTGSMSIAAWIQSRPVPMGDAAIVSGRSRLGYQLSTSADQGPRTVAFRLANSAGQAMGRFGATSIIAGKWYHLTGVYDAAARSIHVYVNGHLDDGCVLGTITASQRPSWLPVSIGIGGRRRGAHFPGAIDDVRIYSRALSARDIAGIIAETGRSGVLSSQNDAVTAKYRSEEGVDVPCSSPRPDARLAGFVVAFGMLVGVACLGLWPFNGYLMPCAILSCLAGVALTYRVSSTLPPHYREAIPLLTLIGGGSIAIAHRFRPDER